MRNAHLTKRQAPEGYVAITKLYAELLHLQGIPVVLATTAVKLKDVFDGWHHGYTLEGDGSSFHDEVDLYSKVMFLQRGERVVFYVKEEFLREGKK